jgi:transposase
MTDIRLSDPDWGKIREFLRQEPRAYVGRDEQACRRFVEAVKWMSRSGAQWRLLPAAYGAWNSVYKRFCALVCGRCLGAAVGRAGQRSRYRTWDDRRHNCAGASLCRWRAKKHGPQALGRSRCGFSCKIHLTVDGLGNPLRPLLTAGQRHDSTQAEALLDGFAFEKVIADRGYAGAQFIASVHGQGSEAVIPPHQSAQVEREYDAWLYRERHLVECCINKLKQFRRIFSRFDKLDRSFLGFVQFVCALVWLR